MRRAVAFFALGLATMAANAHAAKTQIIHVGDYYFSPASPTIQRGDTIKWVWDSGYHTTTSGTRGSVNAGSVWNSAIDPVTTSYARVFNADGSFPFFCEYHLSMSGTITVATLTGVLDDTTIDLSLASMLGQNLPNPFNAETLIPYTLASPGRVSLAVLNILGQKVRTLVDEVQPQGSYMVNWDGRDEQGHDLASGIYFYHFTTGRAAMTRKMVVLR